jgi:DNA-binding NarL/FixJ family response regulator
VSVGPRVLIVDDHALIRDRLEEVVLEHRADAQIGKAADVRTAIACAAEVAWDVVLLDIHLPDGNGIQVFSALRGLLPRAAIALMTAFPEATHIEAANRLGAAALLSKQELFQSVGDVLARCIAASPRKGPSHG